MEIRGGSRKPQAIKLESKLSRGDVELQCEIFSNPGRQKLVIGNYFKIDEVMLKKFNEYDRITTNYNNTYKYDVIFVNEKRVNNIDSYCKSLNSNGIIYYFYDRNNVSNLVSSYINIGEYTLLKIVDGVPGASIDLSGIIKVINPDHASFELDNKFMLDIIDKYYLKRLNFPAYPSDFKEKSILITLPPSEKLQIDNSSYKINDTEYYELVNVSNKVFNAIEKCCEIADKGVKNYYDTVKHNATNMSTTVAKSVSKVLGSYKNKRYSNAFIKLWEIYVKFNMIDDNINAFHMCEAPGQWILTTEDYIATNKLQIKYNWVANSLNHKHPDNIKKFGDNIIDDQYGLLAKFPEKWLYGQKTDNYHTGTGDITISENIIWYRKNVQNVNLVTGDAGLPDGVPLFIMQKLDYAQMVIVLATLSIGGQCVVKCFLPHINKSPGSIGALECYVNLLNTYSIYFDEVNLFKPVTSRPQSGEFYIIGRGFRGISDSDLDQLLIVLDNFGENQTYIEFSSLTNLPLIMEFIRDLLKYNNGMKGYKLAICESLAEFGKKSPYYQHALTIYKEYSGLVWLEENKYTTI
jgi:23S rRNA U2552 (ribose-2'-O)-methylase RlmE/FtsJ